MIDNISLVLLLSNERVCLCWGKYSNISVMIEYTCYFLPHKVGGIFKKQDLRSKWTRQSSLFQILTSHHISTIIEQSILIQYIQNREMKNLYIHTYIHTYLHVHNLPKENYKRKEKKILITPPHLINLLRTPIQIPKFLEI